MRMKETSLVAVLMALLLPLGSQAQTPDFGGVWSRDSGTGGFPQSQWSDTELPFTPLGRQVFDSNISGKGPRQQMPANGNDPLGNANPPGLYRTLVYGRPWEIIQTGDKLVQVFEWGKHWRYIYTDGREVPERIDSGPFWYGYSVGEWQGDTLVVQTLALDGRAWMDEWGTPFSDEARIEERWTRADNNTLELTITVTEPALYSRPWTSVVKTYGLQDPNAISGQLYEQIFAPIDEEEFNERIRDPAASGTGIFTEDIGQ